MSIYNVDSKNLDSEGSVALRDFFDELFAERLGTSTSSSTDDDDSDSCASVSLSSDEETTVATDYTLINTTKKKNITTTKTKNSSNSNSSDLNTNTNHTRRRRFRGSRGLKPQRPMIALSQDNARALPNLSNHITGEQRVSSYQCSSLSSTSLHKSSAHNKYDRNKNRHSLSASAHSLGSRTGISDTSVNNWRNSLHNHRAIKRGHQMNRNPHRDSRWSTSGTDIPNNSQSRVKTYDFGFVNDSLHTRTLVRSKKNRMSTSKDRTDSNNIKTVHKNNRNLHPKPNSLALIAIESAVRVMHSISSDSSEGEEFYEDDEVSLSSFSASLATNSKAGSSITTTGSSLDFGRKYKTKAKAKFLHLSRGPPARTKSSGDLPRLPTRTKDDCFVFGECFEPLKDKSLDGGFQKANIRRSKSDDVSMTTMSSLGSESTISSRHQQFEKLKRRRSDPFGRWAATVTTQGGSDTPKNSSLRCPAPPRRIPSLSRRSMGRYSNHSNDSSEPSTTEFESDCEFTDNSCDNTFAHCQYDNDDDSLAATMATTGSSTKGGSSNTSGTTSSYEEDVYKILLSGSPTAQNSESRRMTIPESLRKLPRHSFHGISTIGSKSTHTSSSISTRGGNNKPPGKSLLAKLRSL
jgi:hypothetical protein